MENQAPRTSKRLMIAAVLVLVVVVGSILVVVGLANGGDSESLGGDHRVPPVQVVRPVPAAP